MGQIKDITGEKFGRLTVLEATEQRIDRQVVWKCLCDCGNIIYVPGGSLRKGHTKSCGCLNKAAKATDLTGQQFGKLTVLFRNSTITSKDRKVYWTCKCDCGNIRTVSGTDLRTNKVIQCQECAKLLMLEQKSSIGPIKDHRNERFGKLVALEPTPKRSGGKVIWRCQCDCGNYCEVSSNSLVSGNTLSCGCLTNHSIGENNIEILLKSHNIAYRKQVSFDTIKYKSILRYDFGLLDSNDNVIRLIEFDGEQHTKPISWFGGELGYEETQKRDKIKNLGAQALQIPLVRIPYYKKNNITLIDILGDEFLVTI